MTTRSVQVGPIAFGGEGFAVIAGPCSIESPEQFESIARAVKRAGASALRGGIFKMRTNPSSFQGLGEAAFPIALEVRRQVGLPLVSEVTDPRQIEPMSECVDMFQVGSRNMHNYALLKELGRTRKPVLLKRGFSALIEEWLLAADYVTQAGNPNVVLCERGIRSFERVTRNTLDLGAVAYAKKYSPFPVVVDPSHGPGRPALIAAVSLAAAAVGADGLIIEVHDEPKEALSDGDQAIAPEALEALMPALDRVLAAVGRRLMKGNE